MDYRIDILAEGLNFPEGPVFDQNGDFWCTELLSGNIIKLEGGQIIRFPVGENVNGLAIDKSGKFWFTDSQKHTINTFDPMSKKTEVIIDKVEGQQLNRPNDMIFDHLGNLLVSCHGDGRKEPTGYIMVLDLAGNASIVSSEKYFTNGITFWSDQKTMIFSETYGHKIWKAKWTAEKAKIEEEDPWIDVGGSTGPDGLATDHKDQVYVTIFGQGVIKVVNQQGTIVKEYAMPGRRPTSCAFHPEYKNQLFITEAEKGLIIKLTIL